MLDSPQEYQAMFATEETLWWYKSLHSRTLQAIVKHTKKTNSSILDAGCGTGGLMAFLKKHGYSNVQGIDLSPHAVAFCTQRNLEVSQGSISELSQHFEGKKFDVIVSNDILCYFPIQEWDKVLEQMYGLLHENGLLILNLPAWKMFSGTHDIAVGIVHRVTPAELKPKLFHLGFKHVKIHGWPMVLAPVIGFIRWRQRQWLKNNTLDAQIPSDVSMPHPFLNKLFYVAMKIEHGLSIPFVWGSSIFVKAIKK